MKPLMIKIERGSKDNPGNYEADDCRVSIECQIDDGENPADAIRAASAIAAQAIDDNLADARKRRQKPAPQAAFVEPEWLLSIKACATLDELTALWGKMLPEIRKRAQGAVFERRKELEAKP